MPLWLTILLTLIQEAPEIIQLIDVAKAKTLDPEHLKAVQDAMHDAVAAAERQLKGGA